eukprot:6174822-Pleurochrysis_carterae.AAC.1
MLRPCVGGPSCCLYAESEHYSAFHEAGEKFGCCREIGVEANAPSTKAALLVPRGLMGHFDADA